MTLQVLDISAKFEIRVTSNSKVWHISFLWSFGTNCTYTQTLVSERGMALSFHLSTVQVFQKWRVLVAIFSQSVKTVRWPFR